MSLKWASVHDSGILRKNEPEKRDEQLFVFGYSCKLFREDERALYIDQGKHLIPWMGDETLKIDRYDARGALHDLSRVEAPPGGHDWRLELTDNEKRVEQLCDEERYRALYCNEDEEEMYKEEELKRLHALGGKYGQVGFNYESNDSSNKTDDNVNTNNKVEDEEPFIPSEELLILLPQHIVKPESSKLNAIIEKTAAFIAKHGVQMEILLKTKQAGNNQFEFLSADCNLNVYYKTMVDLIKSGKYTPSIDKDESEEKKESTDDEYLHPSLAAPAVVESAPSIPSIHYKPSADCDYTMLISRITGTRHVEESQFEDSCKVKDELPPPGTVPIVIPTRQQNQHDLIQLQQLYGQADIAKGPVLYSQQYQPQQADDYQALHEYYQRYYQQNAAYSQHIQAPVAEVKQQPPKATSLGLNLMSCYNSASSDEQSSDSEDDVVKPPEQIELVINKMAAYVARNGDDFEDIVKAKNDPRFTFLEPSHEYHAYYNRLKTEMRQGPDGQKNNAKKEAHQKKNVAPVSFSIKKLKEPEPILPKPALPYESSSEDEEAKQKTETEVKPPENHTPLIIPPPSIIYRIEPIPEIKREITSVSRKTYSPTKELEAEKTKKKEKRIEPEKLNSGEEKAAVCSGKSDEEVISLDGDVSDNELIDLTEDISDGKDTKDNERRQRRAERKARATAFIAKMAANASVNKKVVTEIPNTSFASVLVKTLTKLEAKREEDEKKHSKKRKKHHKYKDESHRSKDRLHKKSKKRRHRSPSESGNRRYTDLEIDNHSSSRQKKYKKDKDNISKSSHKSKRNKSDTGDKIDEFNINNMEESKIIVKEIESKGEVKLELLKHDDELDVQKAVKESPSGSSSSSQSEYEFSP